MSFKRIVLVTKKSPFQLLLDEFVSIGQVEFHLSSRGQDISSYLRYYDCYNQVVASITSLLSNQDLPFYLVDVSEVNDLTFREGDMVIATGPDGVCINIAKYLLEDQPLIGINPDPMIIDGVFMRYSLEDLKVNFAKILECKYMIDELVLAKVKTNEGQEMLAVNDFFVGRNDQKSAYYKISYEGKTEKQSSSGVIISTGAGSSGWLTSIMKTAFGLSKRSLDSFPQIPYPWSKQMLTFVVREAFPSKSSFTNILFGHINKEKEISIISEMPEGGVIFSDGKPEKYLKFRAGVNATFSVAKQTVKFVRL